MYHAFNASSKTKLQTIFLGSILDIQEELLL